MGSEGEDESTLIESDESAGGIEAASTLSSDRAQRHADADAAATPVVAPDVDEALTGRVFADRYRLVERLGAGSHGEVWTADDLLLGQPVALKWMRHATGPILSRIRREITTLRMLRVPGVVRLLDDGVEGGRPFLVMERVEGRPFPGGEAPGGGASSRWTWAALAGPTLSLLEVLARVHAAGIVHRDLKPDNILVSADGRPTVLDFGVSLWRDQTGRLTEGGQILGTPLYLAPEQIFGQAVDERTDLYALGVILYEALTGQVPHEAPDVMGLLRARLVQPAPPIHEFAPDVPAQVAEVIDRLLSSSSDQRFRSALAVLSALRGEATAARAGPALPLLGGSGAVQAVLAAVRARRSIDVVGPSGSGRSRCLIDVAEAIAREGGAVAWTRPARAPLGSLLPVVGAPEDPTLGLAEVTAWMEAGVRAALAAGVVVLIDDAERLDRWSAAVLDRCGERSFGGAGSGVIVRALLAAPPGAQADEVAQLAPLDEAALRTLFAGPDRLLHLREDAARMLWARTEGLPARIDAEVTLWVRLGLARWDGALLRIDREALSQLGAGVLGAAATRGSPDDLAGEPHLRELLRWLSLGGQYLEIAQLAQVMQQPVWTIEAECEMLVNHGAARRLPGSRVVPCTQVDMNWSETRRMAASRAIARALRPGQEGRLFHLLAAENMREAAVEAVEVAVRCAREGDLGAATAALAEGLRAVRQQDDPDADAEARVLANWVKVAFAEGTPRALDRALYELSRAGRRGPEVYRLEALVRAGIAAPGASRARAAELLDDLPPFEDPHLERRRQGARFAVATARASPALLEEAIAAVAAWWERSGEPLAQLTLIEGQALLGYVQGRFEEAAVLHAAAAEREPWLTVRIAATLSCASALLEGFRHEEAAERAAAGQELAARCRHAFLEARAEWLLRAARYRMGKAREPDLELVEAVQRLGVENLEASVCLVEAAVAFRAGELGLARDLAGNAAGIWKQIDRPWTALLARCLALRCGASAREGEVRALGMLATGCRLSGIGVQALGLLGRTFPEARSGWQEAVGGLVEGIPREHWGRRIDVLSVEEALDGALGAARAVG
ncbi:serine/threonine-protein kinase [Sorangium sp. So ce134]